MKHFGVLIFFFCSFQYALQAQTDKPSFLIGVNPSVTVEPFYERGEFDINVLPVVFQKRLAERVDLRLTSILNLGIRSERNQISHYGLEVASPIFFKKNESIYSQGFYTAPIISLTQNRLEQHHNVGLWVEPGYQFYFEDKFSLSLGLQFGATYFTYATQDDSWGSHFGVKVIFGRWF
ncbi:hypothetical protein [Mongoliibacter ruber]|uniref:Outer membrane protein with beta-barrel domain n=1 Tax=Mongoliibacter ruber TaxID=1750599 RepID=A0A2T0WFL2_9BACT|nr:hypothetical protein [Mongoliibacter ruber]PRY85500.1 hypothetical protein CLW00_11281 [Mongoliibacter ruber]